MIKNILKKITLKAAHIKKPESNIKSMHEAISPYIIKNKEADIDSTLYVRNIDAWEHICDKDYRLSEKSGAHYIPEVKIVDNGIILPIKKDETNPHPFVGGSGGVCDSDNNFIAGHQRGYEGSDTHGAYPVSGEMEYIPETVVYGGLYIDHYGHFISECLCRLWWYIENKNSNYKCVFISHFENINEKFREILELLGIKRENVILCKAPARFDTVIVPEQANIFFNGFTEKAKLIYDTLRDSVKPHKYEKVYLTKTGYIHNDVINEEFFENYFHCLGYKVISPENLSVKEQIAVMAGAKKLVCLSGTLGHQIVFCPDGVEILTLNKNETALVTQCWISQLRKAKSFYIDVSVNFLPSTLTGSSYLLMPTAYWKKFLADRGDNGEQADSLSVDYKGYVYDYIELWAKRIWSYRDIPEQLQFVTSSTLADLVININELLLNEKLDEEQKLKFRDSFTTFKES